MYYLLSCLDFLCHFLYFGKVEDVVQARSRKFILSRFLRKEESISIQSCPKLNQLNLTQYSNICKVKIKAATY